MQRLALAGRASTFGSKILSIVPMKIFSYCVVDRPSISHHQDLSPSSSLSEVDELLDEYQSQSMYNTMMRCIDQ